jgi:ApbE superfamily uncharacterized protein (UPF0280 family)
MKPALTHKMIESGQNRFYRNAVCQHDLISFRAAVQETDLFIRARKNLKQTAIDLIVKYRGQIESYIQTYPEFQTSIKPFSKNGPAPRIVETMTAAGKSAGVGPMASVAGAIAEMVGSGLLAYSHEIIVENGGDIFISCINPVTVGIFAGKSPLSLRIGLRLDPQIMPLAICTSSGTIGHSLSFGKADCVCVVAKSCSLADAAATAVGNRVKTKADITQAINFGQTIPEIIGMVIIVGGQIGVWGKLELIPLMRKKG